MHTHTEDVSVLVCVCVCVNVCTKVRLFTHESARVCFKHEARRWEGSAGQTRWSNLSLKVFGFRCK